MSEHSPLPGALPGGGIGGQVWSLLSRSLFCALLQNIAPSCCKGHLANGPREIRSMPENRLRVESFYVAREFVPDPPGAGRFEVVDKSRYIERGVDVYQQVHMVLFPAEFNQPAAPALEDPGKYLLCIRKYLWRQDLPPVLGDQDDMQPKQIDSM